MRSKPANSLTRPFQACTVSCHAPILLFLDAARRPPKSYQTVSEIRRQIGASQFYRLFGVAQLKEPLHAAGSITAQTIIPFSTIFSPPKLFHPRQSTLPDAKRMPSMQFRVQMMINVVSFFDQSGHTQHAAKPLMT